ncbi:hypothetical protein WJX81_003078 [Elliptochloris bilobata]|uniref:PGG domain-containing protein n=1 Tax=Elliptochloris bilobata TaxID=381761 RepID=A0AAW1RKC8_9CHLO
MDGREGLTEGTVFGFRVPGTYPRPTGKSWLKRFKDAHSVYLVVAGLVLTATFNAVSTFDAATCPDNNVCEASMWFRALSAMALCASALPMCVSVAVTSTLAVPFLFGICDHGISNTRS